VGLEWIVKNLFYRKSVLERLGGRDSLAEIVGRFHEKIFKDEILGAVYDKADHQRVVKGYSRYLTYLFGSLDVIPGRSLKIIHGSLKLSDDQFDRFIELFKRSLEESKIDGETVEEGVKLLEKKRRQVVHIGSLWVRLGGFETIERILYKFEEILLKDPMSGPMHKQSEAWKYHEGHREIFGELFKGFSFYSVKRRVKSEGHRLYNMTDAHFKHFVELFEKALSEIGISKELIEEVRSALHLEREDARNRRSLYEKLGGKESIEKFVTSLDQEMAKDSELCPFFKNVDMNKLNEHRVQYFTNLFGGSSNYQGKTMEAAHESLPLSDKHLKIFLKDVEGILSGMGIEKPIVEEALEKLQTKRNEVVHQ
jgi:hemoglobin